MNGTNQQLQKIAFALPSKLFDSLDAEGSSNWPGQRGKNEVEIEGKIVIRARMWVFNARKNSKKMKKFGKNW